MRNKIVHVVCEGQTEQGFVEEVLKPYLIANGVTSVKSILITTNKKKETAGGMFSFSQVHDNLNIIKKIYVDNECERHIFTTMFDYYQLPSSFPGYINSSNISDKYQRIEFLEKSFAQYENENRFIPYIQLHEFEALVFCGLDYLSREYPKCKRNIKALKDELDKIGNPELINNHPNTAPSKRIINALKGNKKEPIYHYNKPMNGKNITKNVGIDKLRSECKHFNEWIEKLIVA